MVVIILIFIICVNFLKVLKYEKELKKSLKFFGYDFSKYVNGVDIFLWFFIFRCFFISFWFSVDGDDFGLLLSLEEFGDE